MCPLLLYESAFSEFADIKNWAELGPVEVQPLGRVFVEESELLMKVSNVLCSFCNWMDVVIYETTLYFFVRKKFKPNVYPSYWWKNNDSKRSSKVSIL